MRIVVTGLFVGLLLLAHPSQAATPAGAITLRPATPGPVLVDWVDRWGRLHYGRPYYGPPRGYYGRPVYHSWRGEEWRRHRYWRCRRFGECY